MDERLARDPAAIRAMFAEVAPRYDLLNHLLSLRQRTSWRSESRWLRRSYRGATSANMARMAAGSRARRSSIAATVARGREPPQGLAGGAATAAAARCTGAVPTPWSKTILP